MSRRNARTALGETESAELDIDSWLGPLVPDLAGWNMAGWEVQSVSQSGTVGRTADGRTFVAFVNLNGENSYRVTIRAKKK